MQQEYQASELENSAISAETYPYVQAEGSAGMRVVAQKYEPSRLFQYRVVKRLLDIVLMLAVSPVVLPLCAAVGLLVALDSPGPIFFSHRRIRLGGAFFSMWKFRTMCVNSTEVLEHYLAQHPEAREEWNHAHKLRYDPRVTAVGEFLRRSSLDELPQIWNVLLGDMSVVGPRPIVAAEVEKYGEYFDHYCRVKPGVTGLWQISGRNRVTYDERVQLDVKYVEQWSLWGDFLILLKTGRSVANQDGAF